MIVFKGYYGTKLSAGNVVQFLVSLNLNKDFISKEDDTRDNKTSKCP